MLRYIKLGNTMTLSERVIHSTIMIRTILHNGGRSSGTGFFFDFGDGNGKVIPAIITNKHVIRDTDTGHLTFTVSKNGRPDYSNTTDYVIQNFEKEWVNHPDSEVDLCAMPIAEIILTEREKGIELFWKSFDKRLIPDERELSMLSALEEITMIGYPNGIWDSVNNLPIIRRGITATPPKLNYNGRQEFMIDAACFPGSSGSPILQLNEGSYHTTTGLVVGNRLKLLGVLYAGPQHTASGKIQIVNIPTRQETLVTSMIPNNLGVIINASRILELEDEFKKKYKL